ncbi:unnamed protein product [Prunus armeniaca]
MTLYQAHQEVQAGQGGTVVAHTVLHRRGGPLDAPSLFSIGSRMQGPQRRGAMPVVPILPYQSRFELVLPS